jgi:hypothetical protein
MEVPATSTSNTDGGSNVEYSQVASCFKNIPIRLYEGDKSMIQKLIKPTVNRMNDKTAQKDVCILPFWNEFIVFLVSPIAFENFDKCIYFHVKQ